MGITTEAARDGWTLQLTRAGAVVAGLTAGMYIAFSATVMPALNRTPESDAAAAMQHINRTVENPLFIVLVFICGTLVAAALAISTAWTWGKASPWLRLSGGTLFVLGNFLVTAAYIDPRNEKLDESAAFWSTFLDEWVPANHLRALLCTASCILLVVASKG